MYLIGGELIVSPSDLTGYLECEHLTQQELAVVRGELERPVREDPLLEVRRKRGGQHEARYLAHLKSLGLRVVEITADTRSIAGLKQAEADTVLAMREGVDAVYQGTFFDGRWRCHADFLLKVDRPSRLGTFSYEVADAKLALTAKASALLQLCAYSEQLTRVQGVEPEQIHVILGSLVKEPFRLKDYAAYYRTVKQRFEQTVYSPPLPTYPDPVEHCQVCDWFPRCNQRRRGDDHLSLVASLGRGQARKLHQAGVTTVAQLATSHDGQLTGIGTGTLERLREQARLQVRRRETGAMHYEILPPAGTNLGLAALPAPSPGDLFFDMEGDPWVEGGGLEYLFGVVETVEGSPRYHAFWAHDRVAEQQAFEAFIDLVMDRLQRDPNLHVYHFAPYEPSALKRLMGIYATREAEVDRLLRGGVLVDLYRVVRQGMQVSTESYGLKSLEPLYRPARDTRISDGAGSVVAYEEWLATQKATLLQDIADYNRDDCLSTAQLRDWLEARRLEALARLVEIPRPAAREAAPPVAQAEAERATEQLAQRLLATVPEEPGDRNEEQQAVWLLAHLLGWHRRENKSQWWDFFRRLELTDEELWHDTEAISGLQYEGPVGQVRQSAILRYRFDPRQEHKFDVGDKPQDPRTRATLGTIVHIDNLDGILEIQRGLRNPPIFPTAIIAAEPLGTTEQRDALMRVGEWVLAHGMAGAGPYQAARDLLSLQLPRLRGTTAGGPLQAPGETAAEAARRIGMGLDSSYLPIQGPPGSGKTTTGARMVIELVRAHRRVGITAISHKVIGNLLEKICELAGEAGITLRAIQKADPQQRCDLAMVECTEANAVVEERLAANAVDIVAGTPFLFARAQLAGKLDTLVVDEAGQMSLANVAAMSGTARNLVLLGDPNQLAQPSHGVHPPGVNRSALEHVIQDRRTLPAERGIFLDQTYRMHADICRFISEIFYDGRLEPDPSCGLQALAHGASLGGTGLRYLPVGHVANRTASSEESEEVAVNLANLLGVAWTDNRGNVSPLQLNDILVVAPYNAQVKQLTDDLPKGARIGTVDKFQGQEAPVVFYSMATASPEEAPRGMEFLYSMHRLNVAVSRARVLAVLVCSPELLKARCRTPHQMRLANALCRFVEMAAAQMRDGVAEAEKSPRFPIP